MKTVANLKKMGIDHLHYMAPMGNAKLIAIRGILSYNQMKEAEKSSAYKEFMHKLGVQSIADAYVQRRRDQIWVGDADDGKPLHDYVPFYFGIHTPMQYVVTRANIKDQQNTIILIEVDLDKIFKVSGVLYTNGNAASHVTKFFSSVSGIDHIDWQIVYNTWNCYSSTYRWKKCAEVLVPNSVSTECIKRFVFLTEAAKNDFRRWLDECKMKSWIDKMPNIVCDASHFYNDELIPKCTNPHQIKLT